MKEQLIQVLELLRNGYIQQAYEMIQKIIDELDRQADAVKKLGDDYQRLTEIEMQSQIQAQSTFEYGWNKAFNQYAEDAQNAATRGAGFLS